MAKKKDTDKILSDLEARVTAMMEGDHEEPKTAPPLPDVEESVSEPELTVVQDTPTENPVEEATTPELDTVEGDDVIVEPLDIDTPQSDEAIDDIVAQESDQALAATDAGLTAEQSADQAVPSEPRKQGHPVIWFVVALLAGVSLITAYLLLNPSA